MNILYTTDNKFVGKVGACICSVFENNKEMDEIHIFIAGQKIERDNHEKFSANGRKISKRNNNFRVG